MASKIFHFPSFSIVKGDIKVNVSLNRFEKQFQEAQYWLDGQVYVGMKKYMPTRDGNMIHTTDTMNSSMQGTGKIIGGAPPYGRFLYMGKVMVDPVTNSPWARKGATKVVTDRNIVFDKTENPYATDRWFDVAKEQYVKSWVKGVKKRAGGK